MDTSPLANDTVRVFGELQHPVAKSFYKTLVNFVAFLKRTFEFVINTALYFTSGTFDISFIRFPGFVEFVASIIGHISQYYAATLVAAVVVGVLFLFVIFVIIIIIVIFVKWLFGIGGSFSDIFTDDVWVSEDGIIPSFTNLFKYETSDGKSTDIFSGAWNMAKSSYNNVYDNLSSMATDFRQQFMLNFGFDYSLPNEVGKNGRGQDRRELINNIGGGSTNFDDNVYSNSNEICHDRDIVNNEQKRGRCNDIRYMKQGCNCVSNVKYNTYNTLLWRLNTFENQDNKILPREFKDADKELIGLPYLENANSGYLIPQCDKAFYVKRLGNNRFVKGGNAAMFENTRITSDGFIKCKIKQRPTTKYSGNTILANYPQVHIKGNIDGTLT